MRPRLLADENTSHRMVTACRQIQAAFREPESPHLTPALSPFGPQRSVFPQRPSSVLRPPSPAPAGEGHAPAKRGEGEAVSASRGHGRAGLAQVQGFKARMFSEKSCPIVHISDWQDGAYLSAKDPALLMTLREAGMILVGFDRASLPMHAGSLTREGLGHAGIILFRRSVSVVACGKQARLLVEFWREAADWEWADRIEYLPRS